MNLEMLVFVKGRKPNNPEKNPRNKDEMLGLEMEPDTVCGKHTLLRFVSGLFAIA